MVADKYRSDYGRVNLCHGTEAPYSSMLPRFSRLTLIKQVQQSHPGFVPALACAGVQQIAPAKAQFKTQTVDYKHADTALEG